MKRYGISFLFMVSAFMTILVFGDRTFAAGLLSVSKDGSGTGVVKSQVSGIDCGTEDCNEDYASDDVVTLFALPDSGSYFAGWSGDCVSLALTCRVKMNAPKNVTATFVAGPPSPVTWSKTLGGGLTSGNHYLHAIQQTSDGGYIGAGSAYNAESYFDELYVVKLNQGGVVQWEKMYRISGGNLNKASSIQQTADGGYIVAGIVGYIIHSGPENIGYSQTNVWILKLNDTGNVEWEYTYDASANDDVSSIQQTSDGGYVFAGSCYSEINSSDDFCITKIDSGGGIVWQKLYGGNSADGARAVSQTRDGGYIVSGYTYSFVSPPYYDSDAWVLKLYSSGEIEWQKLFGNGNTSYDEARSVYQTHDDGYVVAGTLLDSFWVVKLDSSGGRDWETTFAGSYFSGANSVQQTYDGGVIVAGSKDYSIWIMKLNNADGQHVWQKTYDLSLSDDAYAIQQTSDGGFIVAGGYREDESDRHIQVLKLDGNGDIGGCPVNYILPTDITGIGPDYAAPTTYVYAQDVTPTVTANTETVTTAYLPSSNVCSDFYYTLDVSIIGTGSGTVRSSELSAPYIDCCWGCAEPVCSSSYPANAFVTLTAIPDESSTFAGWLGDCSGSWLCSLRMDGDKYVQAVFILNSYTVSTVKNQGGNISPGAAVVNHGGMVSFWILPETGYHIGSVSGCGGAFTDNPTLYRTGPVTSNCTVSATFALNTYTVGTETIGRGTISPDGAVIQSGETAQFTILPDAGYHIQSVTGCGGVLSGSQMTVKAKKKKKKLLQALSGMTYTTGAVTEDCTVSAVFEIDAYIVNASAALGGSIDPMGAITVNYGGTPTFTIMPDPGYHIKSVNGTCGGLLDGNTYTTNPVTGNCTVQASFEINEYVVSTSAGQGGLIDPASAKVTHGNTAQFTITPATGYHILSVSGCGGTLSESPVTVKAKKKKKKVAQAISGFAYTTGPVTESCTVAATFEIDTYIVTAEAGTGGSISPSSAVVNYGGNAVFTVTPDDRYHILSVSGCGGTLEGDRYTTDIISGDCNVTAIFAADTYSLTIVKSGTGNGTISAPGLTCNADACAGEYEYGTRIVLRIQTDAGSRIADIKIDGISIGAVNTITFKQLTAGHSIEIIFEPL